MILEWCMLNGDKENRISLSQIFVYRAIDRYTETSVCDRTRSGGPRSVRTLPN